VPCRTRLAFALGLASLVVSPTPSGADRALVVIVSPPPDARVGARAELGVSVEAGPGLTLHGLAALFVDLAGPDALGIERHRYERTDSLRLDAPAASFRIGLRPTEPGAYTLSVRARAMVCRGSRCRAVETTRISRVNVAAPSQ